MPSDIASEEFHQLRDRRKLQRISVSIMFCHIAPCTSAIPKSIALFFLVVVSSLQLSSSISDTVEVIALQAVKRSVGDVFNRLNNWAGDDPCGTNWTGVICAPINGTEHVMELRLLNMNFTGTLAPDLGNLTYLQIMDFMRNNITGSVPREIGYLGNLQLLLLSGNKLSGTLEPELGNLSNLTRLQIDENNISGAIPPSFQFLNKAKHFHLNNNSLTGSIPPEFGRLESAIHILFDNNELSGELPPELSNISTLLILQLDNNHFNGSIPMSYGNMTNLTKMSMRNCNLTEPIPDLSAISTLRYLDLSRNKLTGQLPSNLSQMVTTIDLSYNQLNGELPSAFYGLLNLELLNLQNNSLGGNITGAKFTHNDFTNATSVLILDFQNNNFTGYTSGAILSVPNVIVRLSGNPVCKEDSSGLSNVCQSFNGDISNVTIPTTPPVLSPTCSASTCDESRNQQLNYGLLLALNVCRCPSPLELYYRLKSPSFVIYQPYESELQSYLSNSTDLSNYQVNISDFMWEPGPRLNLHIKLFPSEDTLQFNESEVSRLYTKFAHWDFPDNKLFGPYELIAFVRGFPYNGSLTSGSKSGISGGAIAGIVIGAAAFTAIVVASIMFFVNKHMYRYAPPGKRAAQHNERIKIDGVKDFTYEELTKATNNFNDSMQIGQGGYGKVYKGVLADEVVVAIKRAESGALQGSKEFCNEIDLLSRVHHRNLVSLIGYCDDEAEQMLVYEYMVNGSLRDHLNGSKGPLDFPARLQIALGSAKGILYLHTEANPPIYHRDIKASNILLD
eukprot:c24809_g2_i1 orf=1-2361(-)